jgi:hypothetical protein
MIIDLLSLRGLMLLEGFVSLMLYAHVIGTKFFSHGWSYRTTSLGIGGLISYASSVQVKAYQRQAPFDVYSIIGLVALTLLLIGLSAYVGTRSGDSTDGT